MLLTSGNKLPLTTSITTRQRRLLMKKTTSVIGALFSILKQE